MKKIPFVLVGILGFAVIFAVSGLVTFYSMPADDSEKSATVGGLSGNVPLGFDSGAETRNTSDNEMLTIVRPALDKSQTKISYGTIGDVVKTLSPSETVTENIIDEEENTPQIDEGKTTDSSGTSQRPSGNTQSGSTQSSGAHSNNSQSGVNQSGGTQSSGGAQSGAQSSTAQSSNTQSGSAQSGIAQSSGTQSGSNTPSDSQPGGTQGGSQQTQSPQPQAPEQKPNLNPNVQTSDTGL